MKSKKNQQFFAKPRFAPEPAFVMKVSRHGEKKIRARVGSGTAPEIIARRCYEAKQPYPQDWHFPRSLRQLYYKYGSCVFVFACDRMNARGTPVVTLITIFGPFKDDGTWWEYNPLKRRT